MPSATAGAPESGRRGDTARGLTRRHRLLLAAVVLAVIGVLVLCGYSLGVVIAGLIAAVAAAVQVADVLMDDDEHQGYRLVPADRPHTDQPPGHGPHPRTDEDGAA